MEKKDLLTVATIIVLIFGIYYLYTWNQVTTAARTVFSSIDIQNPDVERVSSGLELTYHADNPSGLALEIAMDLVVYANGEYADEIHMTETLVTNGVTPITVVLTSSIQETDLEWDYNGKIILSYKLLGAVPIVITQNYRAQ
jgi:hypothetical protein